MSGDRRAAGFTQLESVREQFITRLGIDPYPGTLNVAPCDASDLETWIALSSATGISIDNPDSGGCAAYCYPVRVNDAVPAAIVRPLLGDYPVDKIEVIAAVSLRDQLGIEDGDVVHFDTIRRLATRALIFDVDGTLVDSIYALWRLTLKAAEPFGFDIPLETVKHVLNINHRKFWELVVPQDYPDRTTLFPKLDAEAKKHWYSVLEAEAVVFPELESILQRLSDAGIRLGIVTASRGESLMLLESEGLIDRFEAVVTASDVEQRKPHPEGLLRCAELMALAPAETTYVGDTVVDVRAARAAGMGIVSVLTGAASSAQLSAEGTDHLAHSLHRLPELIVSA